MLDGYGTHQQERLERDESGFTLIELLIVIVVLGILAGVTVFGLSNITSQSAQSACNADAKSVEVAVEAYHTNNAAWPANVAALTTVDASGNRYLRTAPSSTHYAITLKAPVTGEVDVQPLPGGAVTNYDTGNGAICATVK